jgi:hypothetical protein
MEKWPAIMDKAKTLAAKTNKQTINQKQNIKILIIKMKVLIIVNNNNN